MTDPFRHPQVLELARLALEEDLGRGDVTTAATVPPAAESIARIIAREPLVVAGLPIVPVLFEIAERRVEVDIDAFEGARVAAGAVLAKIRGETRALLEIERTLLNFLQRMSAVATVTRRFVDAVEGTGARIVDTRKTIPGWRLLDKYAVRAGGAANHRFGLDDGILVKDNHVIACGGVAEAIRRARELAPHLLRVEVECDTLDQVVEALDAGAEVILLDNMNVGELSRAVERIRGLTERRVLVEASGGMTLDRVREVAATGVDLISVGALTHSAPAVDLSLEI